MNNKIAALCSEVEHELTTDILPFWMEKMADKAKGGFYGRIDGGDILHADAPKGAILNGRILWTFSAAYRILGKPEYLETATRAKRYLIDKFYDKDFGGVYWSLDADGEPLDAKKQIYAQGFAVYGLSEYARATGDNEALEYAVKLFETIEKYSFDSEKDGYVEAFTRDWQSIADMRLSDKDENTSKTMNTHLHILEPYANLYRVWKDTRLERQLRNMIDLFVNRILNKETYHLDLFFDNDWRTDGNIISYGHDIEASWLIHEAALVLGDEALLKRIEPVIVSIARAADEGLNPDGSMIYEQIADKQTSRRADEEQASEQSVNKFTADKQTKDGLVCSSADSLSTDKELHWWVQAENVVGHVNLYQHFGDEKALDTAVKCWQFIKDKLVDHANGEWHWSLMPDGTVNRRDDKAGFWKCPYHNGRMCMEIIERFKGC